MSISGLNTNSVSNLYQYYSSESESTSSVDSIIDSLAGSDSDVTSSTDASDSVLFSAQSQIYCRLQKLAVSNPDKFKEICQEIADKLSVSAKGAGGSGAANLASKFAAAAESGSMDDLISANTGTTDKTSTTTSLAEYLNKYYSQVNSSQSDNDGSSELIKQILSKYGISI